MNAGYCWSCKASHPSDGQTCSDARTERTEAYIEEARRAIAAIEKCSHGVPLSHCKDHRDARQETEA
jgi:hypothetical protein